MNESSPIPDPNEEPAQDIRDIPPWRRPGQAASFDKYAEPVIAAEETREIGELKEIVKEKVKDDPIGANEKIVDYLEHMNRLHPNGEMQRYKLYHVLSGSTPLESSDKFDLDGKILENYIRNVL